MAELELGPGTGSPIYVQTPTAKATPSSLRDRRASDGPRKTTACVACRKLKIKCHMPGSSGPCARCKRRALTCTVNRPLQLLLDDDVEWKQTVTRKIHQLEGAVDSLNQQLRSRNDSRPNAIGGQDPAHDQEPSPGSIHDNVEVIPLHVSPTPVHEGITMDMNSGPATIPASSLNGNDMSQDGGSDCGRKECCPGDIITDGIVTMSQAKTLFTDYSRRLDHYLYRILGPSVTLDGIRSSSPILLAAICTVAALHSADLRFLYEPCYRRFANLAANLALTEDANMDDIRSLCIGAFWLHRLSWNLSSLAVRIATQKHLHRAFRTAMRGDKFYFFQTRLYYLVYVCDHHFSITYGRPPLTRDYEEITRAKEFLSLPHATEDDARLVSQVELWSITSRVLETFGFDVESSPPPSLVSRMRRFAIEYDTWRADWNDRFGRHVHVGNYPRKGVKLHVNFAKLYLCSHAFRGLAPGSLPSGGTFLPRGNGHPAKAMPNEASPTIHEGSTTEGDISARLSPDLEDMATAAVHAAQSILETMVSDTEVQAHLHGLPLYFNTMLAFAVVFLFKIATKYSHVTDIDVDKTLRLLANVESTLKSVTSNMSTRHLLATVAKAVETLMSTQTQSREHVLSSSANDPGRVTTPMRLPPWLDPRAAGDAHSAETTTDMNWTLDPDFDWMTYDFLASDGTIVQPEVQYMGENQNQGLG